MPKRDPRQTRPPAPPPPPPEPSARVFDVEVAALTEIGFTEIEFELVGAMLRLRAVWNGAQHVRSVPDGETAAGELVAALAAIAAA